MNPFPHRDKLENLPEQQLKKIGLTLRNNVTEKEQTQYDWDIDVTVAHCLENGETEAADLFKKYRKIVEIDSKVGGYRVVQHVISKKQDGNRLTVHYWVDENSEITKSEDYLTKRCELYDELGYEKPTEVIRLKAVFDREEAMEELAILVTQVQNEYVRCGKQVEKIMAGVWKQITGIETKSLMVYLFV